jgi:cephalosporin hydroxylase
MCTRYDLLRSLAPKFVAEIGVLTGEFSAEILTIPGLSSLVLVDAWTHFEEGPYTKDLANCDQGGQDSREMNVRLRFANDDRVEIIKGFSAEVAQQFEDKSLDCSYIDAGHDYDSVLADLKAWSRVSAYLLCHDFTDSPEAQTQGFGVIPAVHEFCQQYGWKIDAISSEADWPTVLLVQR